MQDGARGRAEGGSVRDRQTTCGEVFTSLGHAQGYARDSGVPIRPVCARPAPCEAPHRISNE